MLTWSAFCRFSLGTPTFLTGNLIPNSSSLNRLRLDWSPGKRSRRCSMSSFSYLFFYLRMSDYTRSASLPSWLVPTPDRSAWRSWFNLARCSLSSAFWAYSWLMMLSWVLSTGSFWAIFAVCWKSNPIIFDKALLPLLSKWPLILSVIYCISCKVSGSIFSLICMSR